MAIIMDPQFTFLRDLKSLSQIFDFSNLPEDHQLYSEECKACAGKLKLTHEMLDEFIGIRANQYMIRVQEAIDQYKEAVINSAQYSLSYSSVKLRDREVFIENKRRSIGGEDWSRIWISPIESYAIGYPF